MKIIKNYLYNVAYQLFVISVPLITTPYITRVVGVSGVGINAYTNSVMQFFVLGGSVGISMYGNRIIAYERENKRIMSETFWSLVVLRSLFLLLSYFLFAFFLYFTNRYQLFYLFQSLQILAAAFDISWFFMGIEDFKITVVRNFIIKILSTISIFMFVKDREDVGIYIFILSFSLLLGNMSLWGHLRGMVMPLSLRRLSLRKHIRGSILLFIPEVAMQIYLVLNKTMLGLFKGVQSAGLYENSDKIVKVLLTLVTAIATVMMPHMANLYAKGQTSSLNSYLTKTIEFVSFLSVLLTAGLSGVAPKFTVWFMGHDFAYTGMIIPILSLVCPLIAWSTVLGSQYLVTTGNERLFTISVSVGAGVNVAANLILIPTFGTIGAAVATVIAEFTITTLDLYLTSRFTDILVLIRGKWRCIVAGLITYNIVRWLNNTMPGTLLSFFGQTIAGTLVYIVLCLIFNDSFTLRMIGLIKEIRL